MKYQCQWSCIICIYIIINYFIIQTGRTGARCVRKRKKYHITPQGGELTRLHPSKSSCQTDRNFGTPQYFQKMPSPVESQATLPSKEIPTASVGLRQGLSGPYQIRPSSSSDMDLIILVLRKQILGD